jgi:hypothetical protein
MVGLALSSRRGPVVADLAPSGVASEDGARPFIEDRTQA